MTVPAVITAPRTKLVIDFLTAAGWDTTPELGYPLFPGPEILVSPDRAVFITGSGGPGYTTEEGGTDAWSFQARTRGPSDDPLAAQAAAQLLDWTILVPCPRAPTTHRSPPPSGAARRGSAGIYPEWTSRCTAGRTTPGGSDTPPSSGAHTRTCTPRKGTPARTCDTRPRMPSPPHPAR